MKKFFNFIIILLLYSTNIFAEDVKKYYWMGEELTLEEFNKKKADQANKEHVWRWAGKEYKNKADYDKAKAKSLKERSDTVDKKIDEIGKSSDWEISKKNSGSSFTGVLCKFDYKTDYFALGYTNCSYRCDNYVNGINTRMANGNYAYYVNKKIWGGQDCPPGRDD
tara:strand:+ start:99 stop:596 length:498 start_codon:yes stop_codon:yes gene_type:complete